MTLRNVNLFLASVILDKMTLTQSPAGQLAVEKLNYPAQAKPEDETPTRIITFCLTPGYCDIGICYPVICFLPGFTRSDSRMIEPGGELNPGMVIGQDILDIRNKNPATEMIDYYVKDPKGHKALKSGWMGNENPTRIPVTCLIFSIKLENLAINRKLLFSNRKTNDQI